MSDVTAVVIGARAPERHELPGKGVAEVMHVGSLAEARAAASQAQTTRLWFVDGRAVPSRTALEELTSTPTAQPAVSLPVDSRGRPVEPLMGRFTESDARGILEAMTSSRAPLRHTHIVSALFPRDLVLGHSAPDPARFGSYAGDEWTARLFADCPGMLVPASTVLADARPSGSPAQALRMLRTGTWAKWEALREVLRSCSPTGRL